MNIFMRRRLLVASRISLISSDVKSCAFKMQFWNLQMFVTPNRCYWEKHYRRLMAESSSTGNHNPIWFIIFIIKSKVSPPSNSPHFDGYENAEL